MTETARWHPHGLADRLRIAGWWARDYAYAVHWQVRAVLSRSDPDSFHDGDRTPIVVVPGVYETWRFLQPLIAALHDRGHPVHVIGPLRWNNRPVPDAAGHVADYLDEHDLSGVVLVAHSKGGLVGKYAMSLGSSAERIESMLAVATPFGGSVYARFMLAPSLRIFRPGDATLVELSHRQSVNSRIVSVYGRFDPHIPGGSALPGAKNVELATGGHFRVLADPRVLAELAVLAS
ncbi:alpha/beta hydrolase [Herbiconiux sp. CPCC 203407]|uniref:Alpha/beta hydrolase n=1 Tax=Herbiconiux oxytropis TaxID=2970915 RepID=A0AA42BVT0_9MICO|nr:alpha/beta hydrolase [Herbiconiux oxytropis]MCS5720790.1 alpha/beta hydrolase [Herbiconiux oxytropis]MCS5724883.1 alpha/beta hydrolase [Herbiconiux oxytropis]